MKSVRPLVHVPRYVPFFKQIGLKQLSALVLLLYFHATHASGFPLATPVPTAAPKIALAKRVVQTSFNTDGSFEVTFEFTLQNLGAVGLLNAQLTDNLAAAFPGSCAPTVKNLSSATLTVNPAFNGLSDKNLLKTGANTIPVNGKGYVLLTITVANCGGDQTGPGCDPDQDGLTNAQEGAFGTNPIVADTDKNGVPDGAQIAGLCNAAKITDLLPGLAAEVAAGCMTRVRVVASKGKQYAELRYRNGAQCPPSRPMTWFDCNGQAYCNDGGGITNPTCDPSFFGDMSIVKTIYQYGTNTAYFDPQPACPVQLAFSNTASATANSADGQQTADASTDGANPDPNGNGDPSENTPTVIGPLSPKAQIGLALRLQQTSLQADGATLLTFEFILKNLGNVQLSNLSLLDNLSAAFPTACAVTVVGLSSTNLVLNPVFTGKGNNNLLGANNSLAAGKQATLSLQLRVSGCGNLATPLSNTATATGTGLNGAISTDVSTNGENPDPDGDGNPNEAGENEPTPFNLSCWIGIQCPQVAPTPIPGDPGRCTATLALPAAVALTCAGAPTAAVEYRLSGAGAENIALNTWLPGQPGTLAYRPGNTTVEWRASIPVMPWLGSSGTCAANLTVVDTQAPTLQTGVNLPGDLTVDCNAVPAAFVLLPSHLRDNCTAANGLGITYNEISTQCADLSKCCRYTYTLVRTWRATDQAGNAFVHTQRIQVLDRTAPVARCKDKTLVLSALGQATLVPADLNDGSVDFCGAAANLSIEASKTAFACADVGSNTVVLRVSDGCGNIGTCNARVSVTHPATPLSVKNMVTFTLNAACQYEVVPADVLNGSYVCFNSYVVEIDKTPPYGDGPWVPAKLTNADLGKTYEFRLLHPQTGSTAYGSLLLNDLAAPSLSCPPDVTVQCNESQQTARTGLATATDCQAVSLTVSDHFQDLGECSNPRGLLLRTFTASDPSGNSARCTQRIAVALFNQANIVFPPDLTLDCQLVKNNPTATLPAQAGEPKQQGIPLSGAAFCGVDVFYTDTHHDPCGSTYSITRVWNVLNKCAVLGPNNPIKAIQNIRIIDGVTPTVTACTKPDTCDRSDNDPALWNQNAWWDTKHFSHDLSELAVDLKTTLIDSCTSMPLSIGYQLWLDLDNNGVAETVVSSADLPPDNVVFYGNANNPGFTGGEARAFDQRFGIDPALDRYRFALQVTRSGNQVAAAVRFNTIRQPGVYVLPQLPHGKHRIRWIVNSCGRESICESVFTIKDCLAPVVRCKPMSATLQQGGMLTVSASDFYESMSDNCTPTNQLKMGLTSENLSYGLFPRNPLTQEPITSVTLFCADLGSNVMQLWGEDVSGNASFCAVVLFLQDPLGKCQVNSLPADKQGPATVLTGAETEDSALFPVVLHNGGKSRNGLAAQQAGAGFELYQNRPNPFADETILGFYLPEAGAAILTVYDIHGAQLYRTAAFFDKGTQQFTLRAQQVPAEGMLYYRVETSSGSATRKMLRLR